MLDRDIELMIAGNRPSAYAKIKVGAMRDGTVTAVDAEMWGTGGMGGYDVGRVVPYLFTEIPNTRVTSKGIRTNRGGQRAWRAPSHPQACFLTMSAFAANIGWFINWALRSWLSLPQRGWAAFLQVVPRPLAISRFRELGYPNPRPIGTTLVLVAVGWAMWVARHARDLSVAAALGAFTVHAFFVLNVGAHDWSTEGADSARSTESAPV